MAQMAMATAIVASVANILELPTEWCTPTEVKVAVTGLKSATKREMMDTVASYYKWKKHTKSVVVKDRIHKRLTYYLHGAKFPGGMFEHIADSIGAYWALQDGNLVKMFG